MGGRQGVVGRVCVYGAHFIFIISRLRDCRLNVLLYIFAKEATASKEIDLFGSEEAPKIRHVQYVSKHRLYSLEQSVDLQNLSRREFTLKKVRDASVFCELCVSVCVYWPRLRAS